MYMRLKQCTSTAIQGVEIIWSMNSSLANRKKVGKVYLESQAKASLLAILAIELMYSHDVCHI